MTLQTWVPSSGPWPRASLSALRCDKQEPLSGKGGQVGAWVSAPRAVSALPSTNLRQSHSDWGDGRGQQRWQGMAGSTRPPLDSAGHPAAHGASGEEWGMGTGCNDEKRGWGYYSPLLQGHLPLRWGVGFGTHVGTQDSRVPEKMPCRFLLLEGKVRGVGSKVPLRGSTKLVNGPLGDTWWCPYPGHGVQSGSWVLLSFLVPRWCPRTLGWKSV